MKKLMEITIDSGFKKLDSKKLSKLRGGFAEPNNSGATLTASGDSCHSTAVCNCTCPPPN